MHSTESAEMYLENILVLKEKQTHVRAIDIARYTGYSKPSVSRAMGLLKKSGQIETDELGYITLTELGRAIAEKILQRHRMLTEFLVSIGVDAEIAAADACRIEHVISDETFCKIKDHTTGKCTHSTEK